MSCFTLPLGQNATLRENIQTIHHQLPSPYSTPIKISASHKGPSSNRKGIAMPERITPVTRPHLAEAVKKQQSVEAAAIIE